MRHLFLSFKLPEELKRYKNIKLYPEHDDDTPDIVDTGVDIIGDNTLDKDELSVLRLPPDFAVLGRLSENYLQEKCSNKGNESSNLSQSQLKGHAALFSPINCGNITEDFTNKNTSLGLSQDINTFI